MFVLPVQIDSLCHLLEVKEEHLSHIMKAVAQLEETDSLLANRLPVVAREAVRIRTVTQRKKGVAGWIGWEKESTGPRTVERAARIE